MELDDAIAAWRAQEHAPLYQVNEAFLQQSLRPELVRLQRRLTREALVIYGASAAMGAGMAFLFLIMWYDDDPRTWWDFVIAASGALAFALWGGAFYSARRTLALRRRDLGASLRDELALRIALLDYQIGHAWRPGGVVRFQVPMVVGTVALILAAWRVNNEPFDWWIQGVPIVTAVGWTVILVLHGRRDAEHTLLPRRRQLEALLAELDTRE